ncbi:hypothetical protein MHBO_002486 [Bonamia ostreae]|uniref:T-complex protein 1 subunit gamma n=1 Tax=Bonamia ostreae TaxID=126728 RepID=A0ABV2AN29_9EUKA
MNAPILILNKNAQRETGKEAQMGIITASKAIADIVRSTLGPKAMLKMLLDPTGSVVLTNDGASILREIEVRHPAAKSLIELSRTQDEQVGDGTTSVVVLAGELMEAVRPLLSGGMHPSVIVGAYRRAADLSLQALKKCAREVDPTDPKQLLSFAVTALGTKQVSRFGNLIPRLAVEAVRTVSFEESGKRTSDLRALVKVEKVAGGEIDSSRVLKGVMLNKDILHAAMRRRIENPRIMLLDCPLEYKKAESETNIEMNRAEDWRKYLDLEEEHIRKLCEAITALEPDIVICEKGVSDIAQHFLLQKNVSVLRRVRKSDLHRLAMATGARVGSNSTSMKETDLGKKCALFEVRKLGDDYWSFFENCDSPKACSVLLRGSSSEGLAEIERNLTDAMGVVRNIIMDPRVVPGAGASEMAMSTVLRKQSREESEAAARVFACAASALEIIPKTLGENAGANVSQVIAKLRSAHEENDSLLGVDGDSGEVCDVSELGVFEPFSVKQQAIKTAFETATVLLRIDDILSGVSKNPDQQQMAQQGVPNIQ